MSTDQSSLDLFNKLPSHQVRSGNAFKLGWYTFPWKYLSKGVFIWKSPWTTAAMSTHSTRPATFQKNRQLSIEDRRNVSPISLSNLNVISIFKKFIRFHDIIVVINNIIRLISWFPLWKNILRLINRTLAPLIILNDMANIQLWWNVDLITTDYYEYDSAITVKQNDKCHQSIMMVMQKWWVHHQAHAE